MDSAATEWATKKYPHRKDKALSESEFIKQMHGFYVLDLVAPCDGLPMYSNGPAGYVESFSFRAQFLDDCKRIIGGELHESGYVSKLPGDTVVHGERLMAAARSHGQRVGIDPATARPRDDDDEESDGALLHIIVSAANWCKFWGERGHWLEAYW